MKTSTHPDQPSPFIRKSLISFWKGYYAAKNYFGDYAMFVSPVALSNPIEGLNNVLAGASALSIADLRKGSGQACELAMSVCKPIAGSSVYSQNAEYAKYAAMAKAFDSLASQGGAMP